SDRRGGASQPIVRSCETINDPENARTGTVPSDQMHLGTAVTTRDGRQPLGAGPGPERRTRHSRSDRAASRRDGRVSAGQGRLWPWVGRGAEARRNNYV